MSKLRSRFTKKSAHYHQI